MNIENIAGNVDYLINKNSPYCAFTHPFFHNNELFDIMRKLLNEKPDVLIMTNLRYEYLSQIYISERLNIRFEKLGQKDLLRAVALHFFKISNLIKRVGKKAFLWHYNFYNGGHYLDYVQKKVYIDFDSYFYIGEFKKIVNLYKKETKEFADILPKLDTISLLTYLFNYFGKFMLIKYDEETVKSFLHDYYGTDFQAEDNIRFFIDNLSYIYEKILKTNFSTKYIFEGNIKLLYSFFPLAIKKKRICSNPIDTILFSKDTYKIILFMFELLEVEKNYSNKKEIVNYISCLELLLVHSPKIDSDTISKQFINKLDIILKRRNVKQPFSRLELKHIYNYRSKIIHADYVALNKILNSLSKLAIYYVNDKVLEEEIYLTYFQLVEDILVKRVEYLFLEVFREFFFNHKFIIELKNLVIE